MGKPFTKSGPAGQKNCPGCPEPVTLFVVLNATFQDSDLPGTMTTTVELKEAFCGTEVFVTQDGVPEVIPAAACYLGWQESLLQLAQLAEPEINQ